MRSRDRDAEAEAHALAQIATWALTFTPNAGLAPPDAIVAEIGGSLRLFSGLPQLVGFAFAHVGLGIGRPPALQHRFDRFRSRGIREERQLYERQLRIFE